MISAIRLDRRQFDLTLDIVLPGIERQAKKRCGTCFHFQKAPLPGQGWCRNSELRSENERALVSRNDYRCWQMLEDDYWKPAPDLGKANESVASKVASLAPINLPGLSARYTYAVILPFFVAILGLVLFSNNAMSTPVVSKPAGTALLSEAKHDLWLRDDSTSALPSVFYVEAGSKLELIDSKAGEILNSSLPAPSKWYKVRVASSGDIGWAYSGWIERR